MQLRLPLVNVERDVSGASLYEALQGVGFAYIVADETVYTEAFQSVLDAAREFFRQLTAADRSKLARGNWLAPNAGYVAVGVEALAPESGHSDPKEALNFVYGARVEPLEASLSHSLLSAKRAFDRVVLRRLVPLLVQRLGTALERHGCGPIATVFCRAHAFVDLAAGHTPEHRCACPDLSRCTRSEDTGARSAAPLMKVHEHSPDAGARCSLERGEMMRLSTCQEQLPAAPGGDRETRTQTSKGTVSPDLRVCMKQPALAGHTTIDRGCEIREISDSDSRNLALDCAMLPPCIARGERGPPEENKAPSVLATTLRLLHYPPVPLTQVPHATCGTSNERTSEIVLAGAHSDYGTFTLLYQDEVGGLQLKIGDHWVDIEHDPTHAPGLVFNAGDVLSIWTRGRISSTKHRVVARPEQTARNDATKLSGRPGGARYSAERFSVALFVHPLDETIVDELNARTAAQVLHERLQRTYRYE
jgi:isopenicillin N synthase-like dioxygenase